MELLLTKNGGLKSRPASSRLHRIGRRAPALLPDAGNILSGKAQGAEELLSRIWIAGLIPIFVGIALIVNGVFVSKRQGALSEGLNPIPTLGVEPHAPR